MSSVDEYYCFEDLVPFPAKLTHKMLANTPAGTITYSSPLEPGPNKVFYIAHFILTTPSEVEANILADLETKRNVPLLYKDQSPLTTVEYITEKIWGISLRVLSLRLRMRAKTTLTSDRFTVLQIGARIAPKYYYRR
jgi:hypothetical protein